MNNNEKMTGSDISQAILSITVIFVLGFVIGFFSNQHKDDDIYTSQCNQRIGIIISMDTTYHKDGYVRYKELTKEEVEKRNLENKAGQLGDENDCLRKLIFSHNME